MIKKKTNAQNIVIIVLCILLAISIGFGVTYSYYNGRTDLVKGVITTANLAIELDNDTKFDKAEFFLSTHIEDTIFAPGDELENAELNIYNKCKMETYMVIVYSLSAYKTGDASAKVDVSDTPAVAFNLSNVHTDIWANIKYECQNTQGLYTCLVGKNAFPAWSGSPAEPYGTEIKVIKERALKIPGEEWGNKLQGCTVTIEVRAYAIQAIGLDGKYADAIDQSVTEADRVNAIAKAVLEICKVDVAD